MSQEARIFYQEDCNLSLLEGKKIAIIGYGSQGHAHALNLKESGCDVCIGLYEGSKSKAKAESQGLTVYNTAANIGIVPIWSKLLDKPLKKVISIKPEAIESINTEIDLEPIENEIEKKMQEAMEPITEITEQINDLNASQEKLNDKIKQEPERAKEIIEEEIAKAKELQKKTIQKINSANNRRDVTSWWNGIGFSM